MRNFFQLFELYPFAVQEAFQGKFDPMRKQEELACRRSISESLAVIKEHCGVGVHFDSFGI
ncbi:MAG: hypothetical protein WBF43_05280 [Methylocella sp.]